MEQIPIDRIIYQTLHNIFEGQVKRLAIDIAKTLSVDVKPLIQSIRKDKITTYLRKIISRLT
jgi:delta 1-pyrroline-5-carboxylate dehydrogenase